MHTYISKKKKREKKKESATIHVTSTAFSIISLNHSSIGKLKSFLLEDKRLFINDVNDVYLSCSTMAGDGLVTQETMAS